MTKDIEREAFKLEMMDDYNMREVDTPFGKDFAMGSTKQAFKVWQAAKAQEVPKWISVKDNLPPANILVLGMSQTRSNIFNIYNVMALDEFEEVEVTHWMPLPDAPKADAEG
ncbi:DUF551 domain-containing protein [Acinetobacter junii]|uniref:DUF551 domain-containing protein n=1 Tax=Acinetobacter junii TaxID=40215 RepID=UPI002446DBD1|nr:DUF551 domain-containing protein [Acinetobacter junii]MDH1005725.1 DUF551 domain-containing protein [Acinetobacter junii]MDH1005796.1 DUF551 domain-containing protein [Acinetobacter junii]